MTSENTIVCAICLEEDSNLLLPIKLINCGHTFCYTCIKGYLLSSNKYKCPLCRSNINKDILEHVTKQELEQDIKNLYDKNNIQWYYSGRNFNWWRYDSTSNKKINKYYHKFKENNDLNTFKYKIVNNEYIIDFNNMTQTSIDGCRQRKIKFTEPGDDTMNEITKGMAGIQLT